MEISSSLKKKKLSKRYTFDGLFIEMDC